MIPVLACAAINALVLAALGSGCTERLEVLSLDGFDGGPSSVSESCTPGYVCPPGATYRREGPDGLCLWEPLTFPVAADIGPYCIYLDMGYIGFSWPLTGSEGAYACPAGSRDASNATIGYCIWEDITTPPGATPDCADIETGQRLGFRWTCP